MNVEGEHTAQRQVGGGGAPRCAVVGSERNEGERHEPVSHEGSDSERSSDGGVKTKGTRRVGLDSSERIERDARMERFDNPGRAPRVP